MFYSTPYKSPVGNITLACDGKNLTGLWLEGQKYHGSGIFTDMKKDGALPVFAAAGNWLDRYFAGLKPGAGELPLAPVGGAFRQIVWSILREIPYGEVFTYGLVAKKAAAKMGRETMSSQAVGGAVGHNPLSIIIPCHRVVGSDGSLTGYAGGIAAKIKLLELEGADMSRLYAPKKGSAL